MARGELYVDSMIEQVGGLPLHSPSWRSTLILIHGIDGDHVTTWSGGLPQNDWLQTIVSQVPDVSILTTKLGYSKWTDVGQTEQLLEQYSLDFLKEVRRKQIFDRRFVLVAHSLGGLLTKKIVIDSLAVDKDGYFSDRRRRFRGIFFLGVPHKGSPWADHSLSRMARAIGKNASIAQKDLRPQSRVIRELQPRFAEGHAKFDRCKIFSIHETKPMWQDYRAWVTGPLVRLSARMMGPVVPKEFSETGLESEYSILAPADHENLPKLAFDGSDEIISLIANRLRRAKPTVSGERFWS